MKRTTVTLPDELDLRLRREAQRRDASVTEVVRDAVEKSLRELPHELSFIGAGRSGRSDIAEEFERFIDKDRLEDLKAEIDEHAGDAP